MGSEEDVKQTQFERLFAEGESLSKAGRPREAADKRIEAVFAAPSKWTENRFEAFAQFVYCVRDPTATKEDIRLLKRRFIRNHAEPAPYRALAASSVAQVKLDIISRDDDAAGDYFRISLLAVKESLSEEGRRVIEKIGDEAKTRLRLESVKSEAEVNLQALEGKATLASTMQGVSSVLESTGIPPAFIAQIARESVISSGLHEDLSTDGERSRTFEANLRPWQPL